MFRTSFVHLQEDYIVYAALYGMFAMLFNYIYEYFSQHNNKLNNSYVYSL